LLNRIDPINISDNIRLHVIKTDKFKTNLMSVYMQRPLTNEEVTKNALLSMVLSRGTKSFPTSKEMAKTLEGLYGASLGSDVSKKGERNILHYRMQLINDKYIGSNDLFSKGIHMLNELINEPLLEEEGFNREYIRQEKANLEEKIEGRKNDKMKYAYDRCIEEMCKNESFSLYEYGSIDNLQSITNKSLYEHYKNIITTSPVDICVVGDIEAKEVQRMIMDGLKLDIKSAVSIEREKIDFKVDKIKTITDEMDVNQGKLTLGYRTNVPYESELYIPLTIYSNILGGGPNSKLFKNVREKESLCYYIFSRIEKFKSLLLISSGIEFKSYDKAVDLIGKQLEDMSEGKFSNEDMESAKNSMITSIRAMTDSPVMLADFYYTQLISNSKDNVEGIINKIKNTSKEAIVEAGRNIQLDTVYFLKNKGEVK